MFNNCISVQKCLREKSGSETVAEDKVENYNNETDTKMESLTKNKVLIF